MGVSPHPLCALTISSLVCSVLPLPRAGHTGMAGKLNVITLTPCQESCLTIDGIFHLDAGQVPRAPRPSAPPSPTRGTPAAHREVLSTSDMLGPCFFFLHVALLVFLTPSLFPPGCWEVAAVL